MAAAAEAAAHLVGGGLLRAAASDARLSDLDHRLSLLEFGPGPKAAGKVGGVTPPVQKLAGNLLNGLTAREREVLDLIVSGLSNKEAGEKLDISPRTVEAHRAGFMSKLGARNTSHLLRILSKAGVLAPDEP